MTSRQRRQYRRYLRRLRRYNHRLDRDAGRSGKREPHPELLRRETVAQLPKLLAVTIPNVDA